MSGVSETPRLTSGSWAVAAARGCANTQKGRRLPRKDTATQGQPRRAELPPLHICWVTLGNLLYLFEPTQFICEMGQNSLPSRLHMRVGRSKQGDSLGTCEQFRKKRLWWHLHCAQDRAKCWGLCATKISWGMKNKDLRRNPSQVPSDHRENWLQSGMTTAVIFLNHKNKNVCERAFYALGKMNVLLRAPG